MTKPLLRWTIGNADPKGFLCLKESIKMVRRIYPDVFDLMICHNNLSSEQLEFLASFDIELFTQNAYDFPLYIDPKCHPAWKIYPPRVRQDSHEIIIDNDVVLLKQIPQIDEFLASSDKHLLTYPIFRRLGYYDLVVPQDFQANSGIIGFPPGYDFAEDIKKYSCYITEWSSHFDEQGLVTYCLCRYDPLMIDLDVVYMGESRIEGKLSKMKPNMNNLENKWGFHFIGANSGHNKRFDEYMAARML